MTRYSTTLGELCAAGGGSIQTGPFGSQLHAADYTEFGIPSVMPTNIGQNTIDPAGIARISLLDAERLERYRLAAGDIVYARRGDVEKRAYVRLENDGWLCGTGCLRVRFGDSPACDPLYISYLLGTEEPRDWIVRHAVGATMPNLNTGILSALPLTVPPVAEQRRVAQLFGAIDDKIAINRRTADHSRAIGRHRFEQAHPTGVPSRTRATIGELVGAGEMSFSDGYRTKRPELGEPGYRIVRAADVVDGSIVLSGTDSVSDRFTGVMGSKIGRRGDVVLTTKGTVGRVAYVSTIDDPIIYSPQICYFRTNSTSRFDPIYLRYWFESREFTDQATHRMYNTDMAPYISLSDIRSLRISVSPGKTMENLSAQLWAMEMGAQAMTRENQTLTEMRDTLLPPLMSGRLRVKDAEKLVEDAV